MFYDGLSKGLFHESIKPNSVSSNIINTVLLSYLDTKMRVKFNGNYLKQDKITYTHGKVVNIYIVYETFSYSSGDNYPTIESCLFGAVTLTKNADIDNYSIMIMELGLIEKEVFHFQVVIDMVKI